MSVTKRSIRRCRNILKQSCNHYRKRSQQLIPQARQEVEQLLKQLCDALEAGDSASANRLASELENFNQVHFKKSVLDYSKEIGIALIIALLIAIPIRQMWFEFYEIPSGSMRPTFAEGDKLTVTKTTFGINVPLTAGHILFNPDLVERGGVVILAGDNLDLPDTASSYFGIIPYTKRYIKRLIGKPGDSLYFYGGHIWAVDEKGNPIEELRTNPWIASLEYIPFLSFEGRMMQEGNHTILIKQMNQPIARLSATPQGATGEIWANNQWIDDTPQQARRQDAAITTYSDFYGIGNYGIARLLTKKEVGSHANDDALLYLEISHHPNLVAPPPQIKREGMGSSLHLTPSKSLIPLKQHHLDRLMSHLYTARFSVKDSFAKRYSTTPNAFSPFNPRFPNVKDGTYEFYHGKGYSVGLGSITYALPDDHPLYRSTPANVQKLYNQGINFKGDQEETSSRYVYFRDSALYTMGAPLMEANDPVLEAFLAKEESKAQRNQSYLPFIDSGPPLHNGIVDVEKIRTFGITIPKKHYLVLGDNHAMSADSRIFGFVPEENLQGTPSLILWPPGERWGLPHQKRYPLFTLPRLLIWSLATLIALIWYYYTRKQRGKLPF